MANTRIGQDLLPTKEPEKFLGQPDLAKREMREVVMHKEEPDSTKEATDIFFKVVDITYKMLTLIGFLQLQFI